MSDLCLDCGEPLDDYGPCGCMFAMTRAPAAPGARAEEGRAAGSGRPRRFITSMRQMVANRKGRPGPKPRTP